MQGNNKITLNGVSMIQAVQYWLLSRFRPEYCPKVTSVTWNGGEFVVALDSTSTPIIAPVDKGKFGPRAEDC